MTQERSDKNLCHKPQHASDTWEDKVPHLPAKTGVYLLKGKDGEVLYVGKAKNLRARVRSYSRDSDDGRYQVAFLRNRTADLDYIVTDTEKEAVILENNLIKKHRPRYNIRLRDDKTYYHLKLTLSEQYPRLLLTRRPRKGGRDVLFGPFSSSRAVKETIRTLQEIFPLRRCQERFRMRKRPCLNYQMGKCLGPCAEEVSEADYAHTVDQVMRFLKGRAPELIRELEDEMERAAAAEMFERAAMLRDRIQAIKKTLEQQKVDFTRPVDRDVIGFYREGDRVVIHLLGYRGGALLVSDPHTFTRVSIHDEEALSSFLSQLYPERGQPPAEVLAPFLPADRDVLESSFTALRGKRSVIRVPERGEGRRLVEMAQKNAEETLERDRDRGDDRERAMAELQARLGLEKLPRWIECVDISLLAGEAAVGSMVKFLEGEPDKSGYRRYRIKRSDGVDDYGMMREVLSRRFRRALDEGRPLPDLLVVDGGKGQLNVARAVLEELGIDAVETTGLAKDRGAGEQQQEQVKRKGERVYVPGRKEPVSLKQGTAGMFLLQRVRDEAHRFAISYHKKLRGKKAKRSVLEDAPGIGPKKAAALVKHFQGVERIRQASKEEIAEAPGVGPADAERIKSFLEKKQGAW